LHEGELALRKEIEVDESLLKGAMQTNEDSDEAALLEDALRLGLKIKGQAAIRKLVGKVHWEGNLDESRRSKVEEFNPSEEALERFNALRRNRD
jgi:hypothetical protein